MIFFHKTAPDCLLCWQLPLGRCKEWGAAGIVLANRAYIMAAGTECWEYVPSSDSWAQQAFFGPRYMGVAFGINDKGYYVSGATGVNSAAGILAEDVWEFSMH